MIKIYNNKISPTDFYENHVLTNKPCVIRKFYENDKCHDFYKNHDHKVKKYMIGNVEANELDVECINDFMDEIKKKTYFQGKKRIWLHNKNNLTQWHYDGDGANIINICI